MPQAQSGEQEISPSGGPIGELLTARMVNEFTYCARLFWLEVVAAAFEDNRHTVLGHHAHRRVDEAGGSSIAATDGGVDVLERGTWLASTALGVSAKLDRVVHDVDCPGAVVPLDTKKGRPPKEGGLWAADEVQVVLQGLLLREAGHQVERVGIYSVAEARRVLVPLTSERAERARAAVEGARQVRLRVLPPPPLLDSPKCPGCSLVHVCQPDEVNALAASADPAEEVTLRRVTPPDTEQRSVVVTSSTARLTVDGDQLVMTDREIDEDGDEREVVGRMGLQRIADVSIFGRAQITTPALHALARAGIAVSMFSSTGFYLATLTPRSNNRIDVRLAQHRAVADGSGFSIARTLIADKIANTRTLLRRNRVDEDDIDDATLLRLNRLATEAKSASAAPQLLAIEGEAAKRSWAAFSNMLAHSDAAFAMQGRTRRPPRDATNAMLSYLAGMLVRDCTIAVEQAGLDAYLGIYHTTHHGRPSLALDLMEAFRPLLIESTVLGVVRRAEVQPTGFVRLGDAVSMDKATKRALAVAWERRLTERIKHPVFGYQVTYRQVLSIHARLMARVLVGELSELPAFRTR